MLTAYGLRLHRTQTQERLATETLETCRLLFNHMLAERNKDRTGSYERMKAIASMKPESRFLKAGLEQARVEAEPLLVQRRRMSKFGR